MVGTLFFLLGVLSPFGQIKVPCTHDEAKTCILLTEEQARGYVSAIRKAKLYDALVPELKKIHDKLTVVDSSMLEIRQARDRENRATQAVLVNQQKLVDEYKKQAEAAAKRKWWEHPALWFSVGLVVTAAIAGTMAAVLIR